MKCSGLHCAGCAGGASVSAGVVAAFFGLTWVATHLIEVAVTSGASGALSVAAVVWLMRWQDRRQAAVGPLMTVRAEVLGRGPAEIRLPAADFREVSPAARPAISPAEVHLHFYGLPGAEQAAIIRQALPGTTGDATSGKGTGNVQVPEDQAREQQVRQGDGGGVAQDVGQRRWRG